MKQYLYIVFTLCTLLSFIGCNEKPNNYPAAPAGSLNIADNRTIVRLNNSIDSFEVTFTSTCDWHITTTGKAFSVSPMKGAGSTEPQKITISALSENVSEKAVTRGRFDICLDGYSTKHTIKVVQCAVPDRTILAYFFGTSLSYFFDINIDCMKQAIAFDILGNDRLLVLVQTSHSKGVIKELYYDSSSKQGAENIICEIATPKMFILLPTNVIVKTNLAIIAIINEISGKTGLPIACNIAIKVKITPIAPDALTPNLPTK